MTPQTENPLADDLCLVLNSTRELWEQARGKTFFITGGTGFVGTWLLETFAWINDHLGLNARAIILTRHYDAFAVKAPHLTGMRCFTFLPGDVRNFAFPSESIDYVVQGAVDVSPSLNATDPLLVAETIVSGTRQLLELARTKRCQRFLFLSSGAIYGRNVLDKNFSENTPVSCVESASPNAVYAEAKRFSENLCAVYAKQFSLHTTIARGFAFVGPYLPLDKHYAIGNFIRDGLDGSHIVVKGDGRDLRSYLYTSDLAVWLWTILFRGDSGEAYNVGSDEHYTIEQIAHMVSRAFDPAKEVTVMGKTKSSAKADRYIPCIDKAKLQLRLGIQTDLDSAIRKTIRWNLLRLA